MTNQCEKQGFHYCPNCDCTFKTDNALAARVALLEAELDAHHREAQLAWNGLCGVTGHIRKLVLANDAPALAAVAAQEGK